MTPQTSKTDAARPNADALLNLGFLDVATWVPSGEQLSYRLGGPHAEANKVRLEEKNALYAFVRDEQVLYIGKTARTIRQRFAGYCRPGGSQSTNWRCHGKIKEIIGQGGEVHILVFTPISHIRYGAFGVNLAAGLEDSLIADFDPPWNGREGGRPISEEAEREQVEAETAPAEPGAPAEPAPKLQPVAEVVKGALASFEIKLGEAYYDQGIVNPGVEASRHLGPDGDPILVLLDDGSEPILSAINRRANGNGSVRLVGRHGLIARWFQSHFVKGDVVQALILDANRILLRSGSDRGVRRPEA